MKLDKPTREKGTMPEGRRHMPLRFLAIHPHSGCRRVKRGRLRRVYQMMHGQGRRGRYA